MSCNENPDQMSGETKPFHPVFVCDIDEKCWSGSFDLDFSSAQFLKYF